MKQAQVLSDRDCKRVMALVSRSAFANRNRCALQLSWLAGMRVGEIAALNVGDVICQSAFKRDPFLGLIGVE